MRIVADTSPLFATAYKRDPAHATAVSVIAGIGGDLVVLTGVAVELDYLLRSRGAARAARAFARALVAGEHEHASVSPGILRRAAELDERYADLGLGLVDASVMAYAERHELEILTFDFKHFRATSSKHGPWRLLIDEAQYARAVR